MAPPLSICIPTYNRAGFLRECLEAFLPQVTPHRIPINVSDNGSTDGTRDVLEEFRRRYPLLTYRSQPANLGIDRNMVEVVSMTETPYAWLFGDDDVPEPDAVARVLRYLDKGYKLIVVNAATYNQDLTERVEDRRVNLSADRIYPPGDHDRLMIDTASYITYLGGLVVVVKSWRSVDPKPFYGTDYVHVSLVLRYIVGHTAALCAAPLIKLRLQRQTWFSRYFEVEMVNWPRTVWGLPSEHYSNAAKQAVCDERPTASLRRIISTRAYGQYDRRAYDSHVAPDVTIAGWRKQVFKIIAALPQPWFRIAFVAYIRAQQMRDPSRYALAMFRLRETSKW